MTDFRGDRLLDTVEQARDKYGDIVRFRVGPRTVHLISHPDFAREVLVREKASFLKIQEGTDKKIGLGLVLGEGLLTNRDHASWFTRRRILQPVFHRRRVAAIANEMVAAGQKMLSR
jgi:cytochrome P450